jgi:hypothetical protein
MLGADFNYGSDEYFGLSFIGTAIISTFRNSIGDTSSPDYKNLVSRYDENPILASTSIRFIWLMFIAQQYFCVIIMLNFLIAIVSNSYENIK